MKRFYTAATAERADGGWQVHLDNRPIKTQLGNAQIVPAQVLAQALASEWQQQGETIDPALFLMRDHADYAIDIVAPDREMAIAKLLAFAETDTLCYRADPEEPLHKRQQTVWEPLLDRVESNLAVRFQRVSGIVHKPQPAPTLERLRAHLRSQDAFALAGLTAMASLAASLCIALLALEDSPGDPRQLWLDANLEEEWQAQLWGRDEQAEARRAQRGEEFAAAQRFALLARPAT